MTTCPCDMPDSGQAIYYCPRLDTRMTPRWCHLYHTRADYRLAWDEGRGPGQVGIRRAPGRKHAEEKDRTELGDVVERVLKMVGITEKRVSKWIGRPCGCAERKAKMNNASRLARQVVRRRVKKAKKRLKALINGRSR